MKKILIMLCLVLVSVSGCSSTPKISPEEQFKKSFPQHKYESLTPTALQGIYAVYNGRQVYYYLPDGDVVLLGNIINKEGKNLTQESNDQKMKSKLSRLSLDKALKIGSGKTDVVEFIDPNCHYCRLSFDFFQMRKADVTLHVFFFPLSEDSANKIRHITCSKDREQAYRDALSGKLDNITNLQLCNDKEAEAMLLAHQEAASQISLHATPLFYLKGEVVPGFNQSAIEMLLKESAGNQQAKEAR